MNSLHGPLHSVADLLLRRLVAQPRRLAEKAAVLGLLLLPLLVTAIVAGYGFHAFAEAAVPEADPATLLSLLFGPCLAILALAIAVGGSERQIPLLALRTLPIGRFRLAAWYQLLSLPSAANLLLVSFVVSFWIGSVASRYPAASAIAWLAGSLFGLGVFHLLVNLLRLLLYRSVLAFAGAGLILAGVALVGAEASPLASVSGALFGGLLAGKTYMLLGPSVMLAVLWTVNVRLAASQLYVDQLTPPFSPFRSRPAARARGSLSALSAAQLRLITRNPRARFILVGALMLSVIGSYQIAFAASYPHPVTAVFGILPFIMATGLPYTLHAFRLQSTFLDGLAARPINTESIAASIVHLSIAGSTIIFLPAIVVAIGVEQSLLPLVVGSYLYTIGVANVAIAYVGSFQTARFDPSLPSFSPKGAFVSNPWVNVVSGLAVLSIPTACIIISADPFGPTAYVPLIALGVAGLLAKRQWISFIARSVDGRKYTMLAGFRQTT